jgi:DNA-binding NarL/FixJ family response regulator
MNLEQGQRRVLIIDEEGDFSRALGIYLSDLGLRASTASDWAEALDKILGERPEVILINPDLSTVTGEAILGFLREEGDRTPAVVISDRLDANRVETLRSLNANEFVRKTDAFYQVAQAISRVMPEWSAEGAPMITDEEFERIMIQRIAEVAQEAEKNRRPGQGRGGDPPPARVPEPYSGAQTPSKGAGEAAFGGPARPLEPAPLPPPPPPAEGGPQRVRRVRRRRGRSGSKARRVFVTLLVICLLVSVLYVIVTMGLADFMRGGEVSPGVGR